MYFFQFSKNGRRDLTTNKKKRKWAKPNNSTMNRISRAFDDIGNINMNWAGVPAFNWQMLLAEPCFSSRMDIVSDFCDMDNIKISLAIASAEESPAEKDIIDNSSILDEHIVDTLVTKYGSLETCYPYVLKFLFTDENLNKAAHKQTFWRIFGDIAVNNLKKNLEDYSVCPKCNAKIPSWATSHSCPKNTQGFYQCIDCGQICQRVNSKQQRCRECQDVHTIELRKINKKKTKSERKEREGKFTTFLEYRFKSK